jgi:hypothetical protein
MNDKPTKPKMEINEKAGYALRRALENSKPADKKVEKEEPKDNKKDKK